MDAQVRRFRVPLEEIAYVRMIVEGYDGLAVVTSPGAGHETMDWWLAPGREAEADRLALALEAEKSLTPIRPPPHATLPPLPPGAGPGKPARGPRQRPAKRTG